MTVTAEASVVNTQDATLGGLVSETAIKDLPLNGRNYVDLSLLQPGVTRDKNIGNSNTGGGGGFGTTFSVNGAPDRSNNFTLDGAILQNQFGRNPSTEGDTTLGVEGIKEYKVITTNFAGRIRRNHGQPDGHGERERNEPVSRRCVLFHAERRAGCEEFLRSQHPYPNFKGTTTEGRSVDRSRKIRRFFLWSMRDLDKTWVSLIFSTCLRRDVMWPARGTQGSIVRQCPELPSPSATIDPGLHLSWHFIPNPTCRSGYLASLRLPSASPVHIREHEYGE